VAKWFFRFLGQLVSRMQRGNPVFAEFEKTYRAKGFAVVGVSMDEGGWSLLKPFLAVNKVPYRMLLGTIRRAAYGIQSLPDTFLIDRQEGSPRLHGGAGG